MKVRIVDDVVYMKLEYRFSDASGGIVDGGVLPPHNKYPAMRDVA
jgi:hypothetical protein